MMKPLKLLTEIYFVTTRTTLMNEEEEEETIEFID